MANRNNQSRPNDWDSWIIVVIALVAFWPVGLFLLFQKLSRFGGAADTKGGAQHPHDIERQRRAAANAAAATTRKAAANAASGAANAAAGAGAGQTGGGKGRTQAGKKATKPGGGQGLVIAGGIVAGVFSIGLVEELSGAIAGGWTGLIHNMGSLFAVSGFFCVGLTMLLSGLAKGHRAKRYRRYLPLIGAAQKSISVTMLAQTMGLSARKVRRDLQAMLERGYIPWGYLDASTDRLVLSHEELFAEEEPAPTPEAGMERAEAVLREIRRLNRDIAHEEMSRKINRIEVITEKIFDYLKAHPQQETQLGSFLNYYLPTTLKILDSYAQMEAQGIEGENISATKERIEGMMEKVADGFEKQLDRLFQNSAMDISSDVAVLERMLSKDGLSSGEGLRLGG